MSEWIIRVIADAGYWGIFALMALENIFPPIPSELIMGLGGVAMAQGHMTFWPLLIAATLGSTLGNYVWYMVGRRLGYSRLRPFIDRWGRWLTLDWRDVERMAGIFQRHGHWIVFVVRFSPLLRTMISLPAGLSHMGRIKFLLYTCAGTAVWNVILIAGGYWLGLRFEELITRATGPIVIATIIIATTAYIWRVLTWKPRA